MSYIIIWFLRKPVSLLADFVSNVALSLHYISITNSYYIFNLQSILKGTKYTLWQSEKNNKVYCRQGALYG